MHQPRSRFIHLLPLTLMCACAADIEPDGDADAGDGDDAGSVREDPNMSHIDQGDFTETRVDATDEEAWVYLDLDSGEQVTPADPESDLAWDLRFRRFHIALNGGVSGPAGVETVFIDGATLEEVELAPEDGWVSDRPDGDDEDPEPDLALGGWYDYDVMTHVLTPRPGVYVIRTAEGDYALEMLDYYNAAGTSGHPSFAWREVAP